MEFGDAENKFSVDGRIFHRTGDMGVFDKTGRLWLRGRIKTPYFNIEAALHAKFKIGKIAVLEENSKVLLILERGNLICESDLINAISFTKIDGIKYVDKIPVDKRHSTKVDYNELRRILKLNI